MNVFDERPNPRPDHAWYCNCGSCMADGNESQWHQENYPHQCARTGEPWPCPSLSLDENHHAWVEAIKGAQ